MSHQYQPPSQRQAKSKPSPSFTPPQVAQPQPKKKVKRELPEWPLKPTVNPLERLVAQAKLEASQAKSKVDRATPPDVQTYFPKSVQREPLPSTPESATADVPQEMEAIEDASSSPEVQRAALAGGEVSPNFERDLNAAKASGKSLDPGIESRMGKAMGADFSNVKIHTNNTADSLNQSIQARAFTTGNNIFFRQGEYQPQNKSGQELLAHELTHTIQQGSTPTVQRQTDVIQKDDDLSGRSDQFDPGIEKREAPDLNHPQPPSKSIVDKVLAPGIYKEIVKWMDNQSSMQKQYHTFRFFLEQRPDVQEKTIITILLTPAEQTQSQSLPDGQYLFSKFDNKVKKRFAQSGVFKGANDIDWKKFASACRVAGAESALLQEFKTAEITQDKGSLTADNAILEVSGLSAGDSSLQTADRVAGAATLAGNVALMTGKIVSAITKVSAASGIGGIVSGVGDTATGIIAAGKNKERAEQSRKLKGSESKTVAKGAAVNEANQTMLRTDNLGLAAQGIIASVAGVAAFACPVFAIIGGAIGLATLVGRKIYAAFKNSKAKKTLADDILNLHEIKNSKERDQHRTRLLHQNGYDSIDSFYEEFVKMVSADLYLKGVLGDKPEQVALIKALGLKINKTGKEPHPTQKEIAAKYGV